MRKGDRGHSGSDISYSVHPYQHAIYIHSLSMHAMFSLKAKHPCRQKMCSFYSYCNAHIKYCITIQTMQGEFLFYSYGCMVDPLEKWKLERSERNVMWGVYLHLHSSVSWKASTTKLAHPMYKLSDMNCISPVWWCWWWHLPGGVPSPHWGGFCQMLSSEEYTHPVRRAIDMMVELQTYHPWHKSLAPIVLAICIKCLWYF